MLLPLFAVVIAILMVSRIPYPHPLTQFIRGQRSFAHIVAIVFAVVAILIVRGYAVPLLCVLFVLIPPLRFGWEVARNRRGAKSRCFRTALGAKCLLVWLKVWPRWRRSWRSRPACGW